MVKLQLEIPESLNTRLMVHRHMLGFKNKQVTILQILDKHCPLYDLSKGSIVDEVEQVALMSSQEGKEIRPLSTKDSNFQGKNSDAVGLQPSDTENDTFIKGQEGAKKPEERSDEGVNGVNK